MESIPYLDHTIRRWRIGSSTFLAWPEAGARLMSWQATRPDGSSRDIIHWPELDRLDEPVAKIRGGNPILFPFSARTFDRGDIHFWRDPSGQRRPMPMHGFARQGNFVVESLDETGFTARLEPTAEDHEAYPFDYTFRVAYRFTAQDLICTLTLANEDDQPLPWSAGHHFYFTAPWTPGHTRDDYLLDYDAGESLRFDAVGALVPAPELPTPCPLGHPELSDTVHTRLGHHRFRFGPANHPEHIDVTVGAEPTPDPGRAMVTWTAGPEVPYYCVEPWMGPPNGPEHGRGLEWVPPGETGRFEVGVSIA